MGRVLCVERTTRRHFFRSARLAAYSAAVRLGIRLQWVLAFGALLVLTFVPLYFAVARLAQAAVANTSEGAARTLAVAVAERIELRFDSMTEDEASKLLIDEVDGGRVVAVAVYASDGKRIAAAGPGSAGLPESQPKTNDLVIVENQPHGRILALARRSSARFTGAAIAVTDAKGHGANPFVGLVALYMGVVAVALLFAGYLTMTRLVVRPIERLSRSAGKVADGGRRLELPETGAGEIADLASSLRSMTEKLRADEEALRAKVAELETTTRELESAQETVIRSERLASVGRLSAGLAHEIGNPVAAILGFEELLIEGGLSPEEQHDFLLRMKRETERIHRVLRDLLDFARAPRVDAAAGPESASGPAPSGSVAKAALAAFTLVEPQKKLTHVTFESDVADGLPLVAITDERLEQVLLNLLLNASDAAPPEGGKVVLQAKKKAGNVEISVTDNGDGVDDAVKATLFEPFVTTKEVGKGTGLGLAVCRAIVEAAGGAIDVESASDGGARFVVTLPAANTAPPK